VEQDELSSLPPISDDLRRRVLLIGGLLCAAAVLIALAWSFLPFVADDSLISLRYAERLRDGHGLTWTDGERVEGYSNLLWILSLSLASVPWRDVLDVSRVVGVACMFAACAAVIAEARGRRLPAFAAGALVAVALAASGPIAVWAIGGLEQALLAGLLAWALALLLSLPAGPLERRELRAPAVLLALVCLTRPDGIVLAGAVTVGLAVSRGRAALWLLVPAAIAVAAQQLFRMGYHGDWMPNTAHVKLSLNARRLHEGLAYLLTGFRYLPLLALGLLAAAALRLWIVLLPLAGWLGYLAAIGGDIFPTHRHLVPALVLAAFAVSRALGRFGRLAPALAILLLPAGWFAARNDRDLARAHDERWEWEGQPVGEVLRRAFAARQPLTAVDSAGALPYFSRLPSLDMLGLNDRYLATHPPPGFGTGPLAHELGDGAYVLGRLPDLVVFCLPAGADHACFRGGRQMVADPRFRRDYLLMQLETGPVVARIFVRREGRVGVERSADRIVIPGHLLVENLATIVRPEPDGALAAVATAKAPLRASLALPPGTWRLNAVTSAPIQVQPISRLSGSPTVDEEVTVSTIETVSFQLTGDGRVRALELIRQPH
jgi:arabinofuranosyltransferase